MASLINITEYSGGWAYTGQRKLARTSAGRLYAVYMLKLAGQYQIYIEESDDNGATWGNQTIISTFAGMDSYAQYEPAIAVDSNDYLHVVHRGKATGFTLSDQIWYTLYNGAWQPPVRISTLAGMDDYNVQKSPAVAVDSNDHVHVVWAGQDTTYNAADQIWYNMNDGGWAGPVIISTFAGMDTNTQRLPSIDIDSSDYVHVVWGGAANAPYSVQDAIWYNVDSGGWVGPVCISDQVGANDHGQTDPCISVDLNDDLHVVWTGLADLYPANYQIWYQKKDGGGWAGTIRLSTAAGMSGYGQTRASVGSDWNDNIHVVWSGTDAPGENDIWYTKYSGGAWSAPAEIQGMANVNTYPNIRCSFYPASKGNRPFDGCDYGWENGTADPYSIYYDVEGDPFPSGGYAHSWGVIFG